MNQALNYAVFNTADPTIIQSYLAKWANHYHLTKGTWIQFQTYTNGADNNSVGWYAGRLAQSPSASMSGNGFGPSRLYYPRLVLSSQYAADMLQAFGKLVAGDTTEPFAMDYLLKPQPGSNSVTGIEKNIVTTALGSGMRLQLRVKHLAPKLWDLPIYGTFFRVMGIQDTEYNFQARFFSGDNQDVNMGVRTGAPLRPMYYNEYKVGSACWVIIGAQDPLSFPAGKYYGTITKTTGFDTVDGYTAYPLHLTGTAALKTLLTDTVISHNDRLNLAEGDLMGCHDDVPVALGITCNTNFKVTEDYNLGVKDPAQGAPGLWDFTDAQVWFASDPHADEILCIRNPGLDGPRYMYTPNEMFYAFNRPEPNYGDLPYKLQTDENGGFVIHWNDNKPNPGTNFIISCDLSQELGLNEYFEYNSETFLSHKAEDKFFLLKQLREPWLEDQQITVWLNRSDMSTTNPIYSVTNRTPAWTPAPPQPVQEGAFGSGPSLWDRQGQAYVYISNHQYSRDRYENETNRLYPVIHTDENGVDYFSYNDLPAVGRIGNTQMVSVESFSTYSEITIVIPNLPFQSMLGTSSDSRILASLRLPFINGTVNDFNGEVLNTTFGYYGDLIFNTLSSRSYLKVTTDQQLYDCDVEVRLIRRDGEMDVMKLPYKGEFQVKLRMLQTQ
ncbi:MAG TPA: hypothetical protein EYN51_00085 [Flavobacteriales bacterium]|nr:hypothetical protein [Flavobacteriales bacterium]